MINERVSKHNLFFTDEIYNLYKDEGYGNYTIDLKYNDDNQTIQFNNINIIFIEEQFYSVFIPTHYKITDDIFSDISFEFHFPKDTNEVKLKEEITHELNHAIEFYNIKKKNKDEHSIFEIIKIALIKTNYQDNTPFDLFRQAVYLSLDNELNARAAQLYQYLASIKTESYDVLLQKLKEHKIWEQYNFLLTLDTEKILNKLAYQLSIIGLAKMINDFNLELSVIFKKFRKDIVRDYKFIKNIIPEENSKNTVIKLREYFNIWNKIIKSKLEKHKEKLIENIERIINIRTSYKESYKYHPVMTFEEFKEQLLEIYKDENLKSLDLYISD